DGLTKLKKLDLVTREAKQAENLRKLLLAIAADVRVLLIKLADRLHNMRTLEFMPPEARRRTAEETLDIYAPLAGRMGMHEMREEMENLAFGELNPEAFLVTKVEDCYQALGIVHTTWPMVPTRFKDYISTPKQNDYRSLHTTVIGPRNQRVELQIRTRSMHEIAEYGIAAHALYKDGHGSP